MDVHTKPVATEVIIEAKIIRSNGKIEDLGEIAYWHKNPIRRWLRKLYGKFCH